VKESQHLAANAGCTHEPTPRELGRTTHSTSGLRTLHRPHSIPATPSDYAFLGIARQPKSSYDSSVNWYALTSKSQHEKAVHEQLQAKALESYLPLYRARRRWSDRIKIIDLPLFSGYVFCRFDVLERLPLLIIPGVVSVVGRGKIPVPVEDEEIQALQTLVASGLSLQPWPFLGVGDRVTVEEGPLRGVQGVVIATKGTLQLVVSVTLLQRSVAVAMDRRWVRPEAGQASLGGVLRQRTA